MNKVILGALCAGLLLFSVPQELQGQGRRQQPRREMERQVQQRFQQRVLAELGLTAEEGARLNQVVEASQEGRRRLMRREMALRQKLRGTGPLLSTETALEVLEEMAQVQEEEALLLRSELEQLLQVLTPPQAVRFYTLRADLGDRIRRLRGGTPGGPPGFR
jgi:LTXXQ motif family protein